MFSDYLKTKGMSDVEVHSAGLLPGGRQMSRNSATVLESKGLSSIGHLSNRITREMYRECDLVFTMTADQKRELFALFGKKDDVYAINELAGGDEIFDPYLMDLPYYEKVAEMLDNAFPALYQKVESMKANSK